MSENYTSREKVVRFILKQQIECGVDSVSYVMFKDCLQEVSTENVNKEIGNLLREKAVEEKGPEGKVSKSQKTQEELIITAPYTFWDVSMTLSGWKKYASLLNIDYKDDVKKIHEYINSRKEVNLNTILDEMKWSTTRCLFATDQLEEKKAIIRASDEDEHSLIFKCVEK